MTPAMQLYAPLTPIPMIEISANGKVTRYQSTLTSIRSTQVRGSSAARAIRRRPESEAEQRRPPLPPRRYCRWRLHLSALAPSPSPPSPPQASYRLSSRDVRLLRSSTPVLQVRDGFILFFIGDLKG